MGENSKSSSNKPVILHGDLDLKIIEARSLPNMDLVSERLRRCVTAFDCRKPSSVTVSEDGRHPHHQHPKIITSDPYVKVCVPGATIARTRVLRNSQNPKWNEEFAIPLAHPVDKLEFHIKDNDMFGAQAMGIVQIPAQKLLTGEKISAWFPISGNGGTQLKSDTALYLEMQFTPCEANPLYGIGIAGDLEHGGVRNAYFPNRIGGSVTLYQDAHILDGEGLPKIDLDDGMVYEQQKCWEDICWAISEAHHLIYIVGWSVYHKVRLIREPTKERGLPRGGGLTLGELLKYKSQEGVRVLMLVWDDKTSHDKYFIRTAGVMQTHDEETRKFFKHSSVMCVLAPRYASNKLSFIKQKVVGTLYTHHQKCVLVDTQASGNDRKITAFIGGIDLCDGRYDTPQHRLFQDLNTVFEDDFHNPTFPVGTKAPRQPWHDLHCRIDGPAAYDVLVNFEQRWAKATKWKPLGLRFTGRMSHWHDDALLKLERISWILSPSVHARKGVPVSPPEEDERLWVSNKDDPNRWHVQIFRSIDSGSVKGFPKPDDVPHVTNLVRAKNVVIEKSIQTAYIQAIRSAHHFIYIENQYFIGSSYAWPSYENAGADNLIPMELTLKIVSKIRANERFAVYVVIPMWPEGDPNSGAVQEMLFWQAQTMQMMYQIVADELKSLGRSNSHPCDYLNFYCLGNLEERKTVDSTDSNPSVNNSSVSDSWKFQRFMIYVHAKGMIVDDEYVIVGSANINQRSMAGTKDTEIAMGAYQPHYTWAEKKKHPRGQVYGYRMSLWTEHLGFLDNSFQEPESLECVEKINQRAAENWKIFVNPESAPLVGHLLKYPLDVGANGKLGALPGQENIPDVGGKILGSHSTTLPDALTT